MTARAGIWVAGVAGSVMAHGAILVLVTLAVDPEPVTKQPTPTSELEVLAYELDRTQAREQKPQSQKAEATNPSGTALDAGAIAQSRAKVAQPDTEILPNTDPKHEQLHADATRSEPVKQARYDATVVPEAAPAAPRLAAVQQAQPRIEAAQIIAAKLTQAATPVAIPMAAVLRSESVLPQAMPAVTTASIAQPAATPVPAVLRTELPLPIAQPDVAPIPQAADQSSELPSTQPNALPAPSQHIAALPTDPATPNAQKLKAALAFSGAEGDVDPVSIAAFQSFVQSGDLGSQGTQLRDGVSGLLSQVPCSRLQVGFDPDTATLQVNGHIPENGLRGPVLAALRAQMGADITVSDNILILPRPQCGALAGIAGVGLPQSTDQITNPLVIGEDAHARVFNFTQGTLLSLDMTAPDYDAYIYLDYFDADGNVLHLEPNEYAPLRLTAAEEVQQIGAKTMEDAGLKLVIGPPYGQEIAVAFAASEPLYDGLRPIQEPAVDYLEWLTERVAQTRAVNPDFKGEWIYFFVSTAER